MQQIGYFTQIKKRPFLEHFFICNNFMVRQTDVKITLPDDPEGEVQAIRELLDSSINSKEAYE